MSAKYTVGKFFGFESGDYQEADEYYQCAASFTLVTPPSPPTGIDMGSYCALYNATLGGQPTFAVSGVTVGMGVGFWWRPKTNPSGATGHAQLILLEDGNLNGWSLNWSAADKKFRIMDTLQSVTYATSTTAPDGASA